MDKSPYDSHREAPVILDLTSVGNTRITITFVSKPNADGHESAHHTNSEWYFKMFLWILPMQYMRVCVMREQNQ